MIEIDPRTHWCPRHLARFRERWPHGYMPVSLALFGLAVRRPEVIHTAGGDTERLGEALLEHGPLCCICGDETVAFWTDLWFKDIEEFALEYERLMTS